MSNYADSVLATGQGVVTAKNQAPEQRRKIPTVFEMAVRNQEFSIPNANDLRTSPLRPVEISYFKDVTAGAGTTKSHIHTGTYGDSGKVSVTYVTHVETFSLPRKIAFNSIHTYQQMFNNLYEMKWKNLRTRHDNSALAFLLANRVQLSAATMDAQLASANPGTWSEAQYALEIAQADKLQFIQRVKSAMMARNFAGELDIVADLQLAAQFEYAAAQGAANAINTAFQFQGANIATTQSQIDSDYSFGAVLAMPRGAFAGLYWNEGINKQGVDQDMGGNVGILGTQSDPFGSGAVADISMYTERADTSANTSGGSTQDIVDQWEISLTVGYVLPPLSTANDSVVMEIGQAA